MLFPIRPMFDKDQDPAGDPPEPPDSKKQPAGDPPKPPEPKKEENWEERYIGLQKTVAKKDGQITTLQEKIDQLVADLEELRTNASATEKDKTTLETSARQLQEQMATLTSERDGLKKQLAQQQVIINKFPQLAHLAKYIPPAETEEDFIKNATDFAADLKTAIDSGVKDLLKGASPPQPPDDRKPPTEDAEEVAYRKMVKLAGVPGKEEEYEVARKAWLELSQKAPTPTP